MHGNRTRREARRQRARVASCVARQWCPRRESNSQKPAPQAGASAVSPRGQNLGGPARIRTEAELSPVGLRVPCRRPLDYWPGPLGGARTHDLPIKSRLHRQLVLRVAKIFWSTLLESNQLPLAYRARPSPFGLAWKFGGPFAVGAFRARRPRRLSLPSLVGTVLDRPCRARYSPDRRVGACSLGDWCVRHGSNVRPPPCRGGAASAELRTRRRCADRTRDPLFVGQVLSR